MEKSEPEEKLEQQPVHPRLEKLEPEEKLEQQPIHAQLDPKYQLVEDPLDNPVAPKNRDGAQTQEESREFGDPDPNPDPGHDHKPALVSAPDPAPTNAAAGATRKMWFPARDMRYIRTKSRMIQRAVWILGILTLPPAPLKPSKPPSKPRTPKETPNHRPRICGLKARDQDTEPGSPKVSAGCNENAAPDKGCQGFREREQLQQRQPTQ